MKNVLKMAKMIICVVCMSGLSMLRAENMIDWTTSGSYRLGSTTSFTMPADGEIYLSLSGVKPGNEYTFVANGPGAGVDVVYTYKDEEGDIWDDTLASGEFDVKTATAEPNPVVLKSVVNGTRSRGLFAMRTLEPCGAGL